MKKLTATAILTLALLAGTAQAQLSANRGPIDVTGDNVEYLDLQRQIIYRGRVEALQDQNRLRADTVTITFAPRGTAAGGQANIGANVGDFERLEAVGNVYFVTPTQVVKGDRAVYEAAPDTITVTGNVVLTQGENVVQGSTLVLDNKTGRATLDAAPGQNGGRVRGVFYPERDQSGGQRR